MILCQPCELKTAEKWTDVNVQLHENGYDTGQALQALVKVINPKSVDKRWSDDDAVSALLLCCSVLL